MVKNIIFGLQLIYFPVLIFTPLSLTGYFTDLIALISIDILSVYWFIYKKQNSLKLVTTIIYSAVISIWLIFTLLNPFSWNQFKVKTFDIVTKGNYIQLNYFKPVGSWGCGYGSHWKTKTFKYFPILEYQINYNHCVHDDYGYYIETGKWE